MAQRAEHMTNAQQCTYRTLQHMAGLAVTDRGHRLVKVNPPEPLHHGDAASVMVLVESWDPTIRTWDPTIRSDEDPSGWHRSERTFIIEAGGCAVMVLT